MEHMRRCNICCPLLSENATICQSPRLTVKEESVPASLSMSNMPGFFSTSPREDSPLYPSEESLGNLIPLLKKGPVDDSPPTCATQPTSTIPSPSYTSYYEPTQNNHWLWNHSLGTTESEHLEEAPHTSVGLAEHSDLEAVCDSPFWNHSRGTTEPDNMAEAHFVEATPRDFSLRGLVDGISAAGDDSEEICYASVELTKRDNLEEVHASLGPTQNDHWFWNHSCGTTVRDDSEEIPHAGTWPPVRDDEDTGRTRSQQEYHPTLSKYYLGKP